MIPELKAQIANIIFELLPIEENKWRIYGKCKENIQNYEVNKRIAFKPFEYHEYINYITDKLHLIY